MVVRFIEYITVDGKELGLYVIQQIPVGETRSFHVQVHDNERFEFILSKDCNTSWQIITHDDIGFNILKLLPLLTKSIEQRMGEQQAYLSPN